MSFPLAQTVQHRPFTPGAEDAHGNPVEAWGPAVAVNVYGWSAANSLEPTEPHRDEVTIDVAVYAPDSWVVHAHDRVIVNGTTFDVVGEPDDYNHGPFGWQPGVVVNLKRIEG